MSPNPPESSWFTVPNLLSFTRILLAPVLIVLAFLGYRTIFIILFAVSVSTDALDGYFARKLKQMSEFGSKLDGWADLVMWVGAFICFFILWPQIARREAPYAVFAVFAYVLPMIVGFLKYKNVPIYHCYSAKFQAVFMSIAVFVLLLSGLSWPFRCAAIMQSIAAIEDISITILFPTCHNDIPSLWHAVKLTKNQNRKI